MTGHRKLILLLMIVSVGGLWTAFYHYGVREEGVWVGVGGLLAFYEYVFLW